VSVAGALGLMQIMPFWIKEIGRPDDNLLHTNTNLRYGCTILRFYYDKENGDLRRALGRYNGSLGKRKYPNKGQTSRPPQPMRNPPGASASESRTSTRVTDAIGGPDCNQSASSSSASLAPQASTSTLPSGKLIA
jgi:hypothetical protein